jgi:peptidyl-prolyl cis-trans isomerase C
VHSACPSGKVGGNLGQIGPGQTVPEFERALKTISVNGRENIIHAAPIESRYGFHIVKINHHEAGRQLPFEMVQLRIADYLREHVQRTAIRQYIAMLAGRATVTGTDLVGAATPLVQ